MPERSVLFGDDGAADSPRALPDRVRRAAARRAAGFAERVVHRASGRRMVPVEHWQTPIVLEQPPNSRNAPRWGHGEAGWHPGLKARIDAHREEYLERLGMIVEYGDDLARIPREHVDPAQPCWDNPMFIGLDGAALYGFLRRRRPRTYLEVGSGFSTRFAARAKRDGDLPTRIVSIDPAPRAEVDALCDEVVRTRVEEADLSVVDALEPGDVLFFDGSHRVFMNNDVAVFWLDILPRVKPGVLVGVHDVWLPEDYPPGHADKWWTEQYLLAVALLFGDRLRPVLPCHYVCVSPDLARVLNESFTAIGLDGINGYGSAFWFEPQGS